MTKIKTAKGLILKYMDLCGFNGWTSFWNVIYIRPGWEQSTRLIRHEMCHIQQMRQEGKFLFAVKYLWLTIKYGYYLNPYEVAARAAEKEK